MKNDEIQFLLTVFLNITTPREIINSNKFSMNYKRAEYLLTKWSTKGWYEYGVAIDLGWLTDDGKKEAKKISGLTIEKEPV